MERLGLGDRVFLAATMRRHGHTRQGQQLAVSEGDYRHDAVRVSLRVGRRPIRYNGELPSGTGQWTPPRNRVQVGLRDQVIQRQGGDVEVP